MSVFAQLYFPEGTKWTEIRLDTLKYDNWYSEVGRELVPNFETVEYYVKEAYVDVPWNDSGTCSCVYSSGPTWTDSLTLMIWEGGTDGEGVWATVPVFHDGNQPTMSPSLAYQFAWETGQKLYCQNILGANCDCVPPEGIHDFGTIEKIKEDNFGGARTLKYVDLNGVRIIQGIGVTEWNGGECLFGPIEPYGLLVGLRQDADVRHYCSRLVRFERGGEVLYDAWPEKETNGIVPTRGSVNPGTGATYDLQGRPVQQPRQGIYVRQGRKWVK